MELLLIWALLDEIKEIRSKGVKVDVENLIISDLQI